MFNLLVKLVNFFKLARLRFALMGPCSVVFLLSTNGVWFAVRTVTSEMPMLITVFADSIVVGSGDLSPWCSFAGLELRVGGLGTAFLAPATCTSSRFVVTAARQKTLSTLVVIVAKLAKGI